MRNKYIIAEMTDHNDLWVTADVYLWDMDVSILKSVRIKIDTGCMNSVFSLKAFGLSSLALSQLKTLDIQNKSIKKRLGFGINDIAENKALAKQKLRNHGYDGLTALSFIHNNVDIDMYGTEIHDVSISISYDKPRSLLGMDILSQMDMHIGNSKILDKTVLLACPYTMLNDDYYRALEDHFGLGSSLVFAQVFQPEQ